MSRWPFHLSVSATTREPREGEVDGQNYFFLSESQFQAWIDDGRFLEWATFSGHRYGTPRASVEAELADGRDVILEIEVQGAMQIKQAMPDALFIFIQPPTLEELKVRLAGRGDTADMDVRLKRAKEELAVADEFDHVVVNDQLSDAVAAVLFILARSEVLPE